MATIATHVLEKPLDPRSQRSRAKIMDAAIAIILEEGLARCTIDAILKRTGVARTTFYRHWPGRVELLDDATDVMSAAIKLPDTGDLRRDMVEFFDNYGRGWSDQGGSAAQHLAWLAESAQGGTLLSRLERKLSEQWRRNVVLLLERARERGELRRPIDLGVAAEMLVGGMMAHVLFMRAPMSADFIGLMIDVLRKDAPASRP